MIDLKKIKPAPGYLLIKPSDEAKKTQSGIYLPDSHENKSQIGEVLVAGAAIYDDGQEVKGPAAKGQKVIYKKWGGTEFSQGIGQEDLLFVKFEDIVAVIG